VVVTGASGRRKKGKVPRKKGGQEDQSVAELANALQKTRPPRRAAYTKSKQNPVLPLSKKTKKNQTKPEKGSKQMYGVFRDWYHKKKRKVLIGSARESGGKLREHYYIEKVGADAR